MKEHLGRKNYRTQFIMDGVIYPVRETPGVMLEGRTYSPESWNIMCPDCGDIWAKRIATDMPNHWTVRLWVCRGCGNGSLWGAFEPAWNKALPPELVMRELDIIQDWWDQGIRTYNQFFLTKYLRRKE